jgi:hypothetical protein
VWEERVPDYRPGKLSADAAGNLCYNDGGVPNGIIQWLQSTCSRYRGNRTRCIASRALSHINGSV